MDNAGKAPEALTRAVCLTLLQPGGIGRIAYSQRALPAIVTVGYAVVDEVLVLRLDEDSPELASLRNSVVAFQTDHGSQRDERSWSVTCVGKARPVEDAAEALDLALGNDWTMSTTGRPAFLRMESDLLEGRVFHALPLAPNPRLSPEAAPAS